MVGTAGEFIPATEPDWLTIPQVAKRLGIHRSTASRLVAEGRFPMPTLLLGSKRVVSKRVYERYVDGERQAS